MAGKAWQHVQADAEDHHADEAKEHEVGVRAQGVRRKRCGKCQLCEPEEPTEQGVGERRGYEPAIARKHSGILAVASVKHSAKRAGCFSRQFCTEARRSIGLHVSP